MASWILCHIREKDRAPTDLPPAWQSGDLETKFDLKKVKSVMFLARPYLWSTNHSHSYLFCVRIAGSPTLVIFQGTLLLGLYKDPGAHMRKTSLGLQPHYATLPPSPPVSGCGVASEWDTLVQCPSQASEAVQVVGCPPGSLCSLYASSQDTYLILLLISQMYYIQIS